MKIHTLASFTLGVFMAGGQLMAQPKAGHWSVASPNGKTVVSVEQAEGNDPVRTNHKRLYYSVELEGKEVIEDSPLGVTMEGADGDFVNGLTYQKVRSRNFNETYALPSGKKRVYVNHGNEIGITFVNAAGREMTLFVRAYDDGMAYRYFFPGAGEERTITTEASGFKVPMNSNGWGQPTWSGDNFNHESQFRGGVVGKDFFTTRELCFPVLFEIPEGRGWVLITEAAVYGDYCISRLEKFADGYFKVKHNRTGGKEDTATSRLPWYTPWRVAIIGKTLAPIVETNLCENLNPPSEIEDMSWIKPGRTSWTWWYSSEPPVGMSEQEFSRVFYEFAVDEMGWEYGAGHGQTWCDWSGTYSARPSPGLKEELSNRGMLAEELDKELGTRAAHGAVLFKCDFMDSDSQERVKDYDLIAQVCMKHKMMINWHGARVPGGERRRWPHMIGYEGVYGAEWYKADVGGADAGPTVFHRLCLPFTRNVIGPMDYTGVTFTGEAADQRNNSDAAELAIAMLYETGFSYWGDHPDAYRARPAAMSFLKKCPSAWEETRFIDGYPGRFVCLARKSLDGKTWFIGAMSNRPAQEVLIALDFLTKGKRYEMELHRDGADRSVIETDHRRVTSDTVLRIRTLENGGFCGVFTCAKI